MNDLPAKGSKRRLAFILLFVVWCLKFVFGFVAGRNAPVYPDAASGFPHPYMGDAAFYVVMPAAFAVLDLLMAVFASKVPKWLAIIVATLQIVMLLILVFLGTGGI